ncbi:MAG: 4-alpha-glucanotransferase [Desulfobacteraceae bacterium]|nr:MAG: 4-alpha-glucanotransferase [Desulfobacteraceae bacterium]
MRKRASGILLHITSLPSRYGIGDMGPEAYRFVDFLEASGQKLWQILPLNPTDTELGNSPYHSTSAFAINPLAISPDLLLREGLIEDRDLETPLSGREDSVDYPWAERLKKRILSKAFERFKARGRSQAFSDFIHRNEFWLKDFALFQGLKEKFEGRVWSEWPGEYRDRDTSAVREAMEELSDSVERLMFFQFLAFSQWERLRDYCRKRGVELIGDVTIYVNYDSADVWTHPEIFKLDKNKCPIMVAGVPPDYFSETGQLWGNPLYRWHVLRERNYDWWLQRIGHNLSLYDRIRIDHFRGFVAYWEVKAGEKSAINGRWIEAPAVDFFNHLAARFPDAPIIAEDLGVITPDVTDVMRQFGYPGMRLLIFAFGGDVYGNPYLPHNMERNCIVYTGTHDNNTIRGWFQEEITPVEKMHLLRYIGRDVAPQEIHWEMIRMAMMSVADTAIFPMQDLLGLGSEARMNRPSKPKGNWQWRVTGDGLNPALAERLRDMTEIYGRLPG